MQDVRVTTVAFVEDDPAFAQEMSEFLEGHGLKTVLFDTLTGLIQRLQELQPDLLLLDQFVSGRDSLPLLHELRSTFAGGIMVLTGNDDRTDRVVALEVGADDFIAKSVGPRELLARLRSVLRRTLLAGGTEQKAIRIKATGKWHIDTRRLEIQAPDGMPVKLTRTEFHALIMLLQHAGELVTRDDVSLTVLDRRFSPLDRCVDNMISRIRKALEPHLAAGQAAISSVRGKGYILDAFTLEDVVLTDPAGLMHQHGIDRPIAKEAPMSRYLQAV